MSYLTLKNILLKYYGKAALALNSFEAGKPFALIGCSGSGKSNFLKVLAGLVTIESGEIYVGGEEIGGKKPAQRNVSLISARTPLSPRLSAQKNLECPLKKRRYTSAQIDQAVKSLSEELAETDLFSDLSGDTWRKKAGLLLPRQQTELIFARALIKNPRLVLLDEPEEVVADMPYFIKLLRGSGRFFVLATYDFDLAAQFVSRFVVLRRGEIVFDGDMHDLQNCDNEYAQKMCFAGGTKSCDCDDEELPQDGD